MFVSFFLSLLFRYVLPLSETKGRQAAEMAQQDASCGAWAFSRKGFLSAWLAADKTAREVMMKNTNNKVPESKELVSKKAERHKLETKWETVKEGINEYKEKVVCMGCDSKERQTLVLPCSHFVLCKSCTREGAVCPKCKEFVGGYLEPIF